MLDTVSEKFLARCLDVYDPDFIPQIEEPQIILTPEMMLEDDIDFLSEKQFKLTNRINTARLKQFSLLQSQKEPQETIIHKQMPICSPAAQKKMLNQEKQRA